MTGFGGDTFGGDTFDDEDFGIVGITNLGDKKTPVAVKDRPRDPEPAATPAPARESADVKTRPARQAATPTADPAPTPKPKTAKRTRTAATTPAATPTPSTVAAAPAPVRPHPPAVKGEWRQLPAVDATVGAADPSDKLSNRWDAHLLVLAEQAHMRWLVDSNSTLPTKARMRVGQSTIMEALLRVGLQHINDPDLFRLVRPDGRRNTGDGDATEVPAGNPAQCDQWAAGLDWSRFDGTLVRHTGYCRSGLTESLQELLLRWYIAHPEFMVVYGSKPGAYAFREGLIRLGIKHLTTSAIDTMLSL